MMRIARLAYLLLLSYLCTDLGAGQATFSPCSAAATCDECLQAATNCYWCTTVGFSGNRCYENSSSTCADEIGSTGTITLTQNDPTGPSQLLSPQRINIQSRLGEQLSFQMNAFRARNSPLDVYFVVDQSFTMADDLDTIRSLTSDLFARIEEITTNFRVGLGLYVDKPITPFISETPENVMFPCGQPDVCISAYGYRHVVNLTNDVTIFQNVIGNITISGNIDGPEGGMDAVLQAALCTDIIGWRDSSLKLMFYISDNVYHIAGDGKTAGIVHPPSTTECLLERNVASFGRGNSPIEFFEYNDAILYDYPTPGTIDEVLAAQGIFLVFAVTDTATDIYQDLVDNYVRFQVMELANTSSNLIDLLEAAYTALTADITPSSTNIPDNLEISFTIRSCLTGVSGITCQNVEFDTMVSYNVALTVTSCDGMQSGSFDIIASGFGEIEVMYQLTCQCACSTPVEDSPDCSNQGRLHCGQCECNPGRYGSTCLCDEDDAFTRDLSNCPSSDPSDPVGTRCSSPDRGQCQCGICECIRPFTGSACECDNRFCELDSENNLCGGPARGACTCNGCTCRNGWTGASCNCTPATDNCRDNIGLVCGEQGVCMCDQCVCNEGFFGQVCQECTLDPSMCPNPACRAYADCVICQQSTRGTPAGVDCDDLLLNSCGMITVLNSTIDDEDRSTFQIDGSAQTVQCAASNNDCSYRYFVGTTQAGAVGFPPIVVEREVCRNESSFPTWVIIVIILGVLLLIGILVLVGIKIYQELKYRYEYQQWLKERDSTKFGQTQNPLYTSATTDIQNPLYDKKKRQKLRDKDEAI